MIKFFVICTLTMIGMIILVSEGFIKAENENEENDINTSNKLFLFEFFKLNMQNLLYY